MAANTAKGARITIRLDDDVHAWLEEQARELALDVATFVRMRLMELRSGRIGLLRPVAAIDVQPQLEVAAALSRHDNIRTSWPRLTGNEQLPAGGYNPELPGEPAEPVDANELVRQALRNADNAGLTQQRFEEEDEPFMGGVRPAGPRHSWEDFKTRTVMAAGR